MQYDEQRRQSFIRFIEGRAASIKAQSDTPFKQTTAPNFYIVNGKPYWTICRVHKRSLTYTEMQQQQCHWCEPKFASEYLSDGKTKNPCYNHEAHRPFTKEEMNERIADGKRYRKKTS